MRLGILTAAIPSVPTHFEPRPGTYALVLSSASDAVIRVRRLGSLLLQPGSYVYVDSALASGGVRARLAHHMRLAERPHWHIRTLWLFRTIQV